MRFDTMTELIEREFDRIREVRETKGREYAGEEDTLADFKEVAEETGTNAFQVWATYVKKHQRAIDTFIREGGVRSESIESRVMDVIVYHLLLLGLIQDLVEPMEGNASDEERTIDYSCGAPWGTYRCALPYRHTGQHVGRGSDGEIHLDVTWNTGDDDDDGAEMARCTALWGNLRCKHLANHSGPHLTYPPGYIERLPESGSIVWDT